MQGPTQKQTGEPGLVGKLIAQLERFLRFLSSRVESTAVADDIFRTAYLKVIDRGAGIRGASASGLAAPMAAMVGRHAQLDIHIRKAAALDAFLNADTFIFDRTSTLTEGKLQRTSVVRSEDFDHAFEAQTVCHPQNSSPEHRYHAQYSREPFGIRL